MRLLDLFDRFLIHLEHERQCARGTVVAYRSDFLQFLAWLDRTLDAERVAGVRPKANRTHDLAHLTTDRVRGWQASLSMERRLAPSAIRRKLHAFGAFCKFLVATGTIGPSQNPMLGVVAPKKRRRVRQGLRLDDWRRVMAIDLSPREHTMRAVLALGGLRREELVTLTVGDLRLELATQGTIRVRGKGDRERLVPAPAALREILLDYILRTGRTGPRERLFTKTDGAPLSFSAVNRMVTRWGKAVGLHLHPHLFRHCYATFLVLSGVPLPVLQAWLGHEDLATTAAYLHAAHDSGGREALEKFAGSVRAPLDAQLPAVTPQPRGES